MSLIDEALKRARLEAAQRAAESEGLPYPTIPRHLAPRRRRRWLVPAAVTMAVITGLVVGLMLASRGAPQADRVLAPGGGNTAAEAVTSAPPTPMAAERDPLPIAADPAAPAELVAGGPAPQPAGPTPGDRPAERRAAERPPVTRQPTAAPPADAAPASPPRVSPRAGGPPAPSAERTNAAAEPAASPPPAPPPAATEQTPRRSAPPPATSTVTDPDSGVLLVLPERPTAGTVATGAAPAPGTPVESHVQRFPLPDGGAIELGGIAWSESGPFALINGRVVGPGSVIGDYTLERIQPGHVELAGDDRRIHLSLQ